MFRGQSYRPNLRFFFLARMIFLLMRTRYKTSRVQPNTILQRGTLKPILKRGTQQIRNFMKESRRLGSTNKKVMTEKVMHTHDDNHDDYDNKKIKNLALNTIERYRHTRVSKEEN